MTKWMASVTLAALVASCGQSVSTSDGGEPSCEGRGRSRCSATLSLGAGFACAALRDRSVWCWGRNDENQLGYESSEQCPERAGAQRGSVACNSAPQRAAGVTSAIALSAGGAHACAITADATLQCWGGNAFGQLGNGASLPTANAVDVTALRSVTAVAAGARHTCAIADGRVWCWGANDRAQLGVSSASATCMGPAGVVACARTPVLVAGLEDAVELAAGDEHTCARTRAGRVHCWGTNLDGELGRGTAEAAAQPTPALALVGTTSITRVTAISAAGHHTCALRADDAVVCWGRNDRGQLGVPIATAPFAPCVNACVPMPVAALAFDVGSEEQIDAGLDSDAGDARADSARDAGRSDAGAADGAHLDGGLTAPPMAKPTMISTGAAFTCVRLEDRTARCWGSNRSRELGDGRLSEGGPELATVIASPGAASTNPLQNISAIESGGGTSCALLDDQSVRCWGSNASATLGVGSADEQGGPVAVTW